MNGATTTRACSSLHAAGVRQRHVFANADASLQAVWADGIAVTAAPGQRRQPDQQPIGPGTATATERAPARTAPDRTRARPRVAARMTCQCGLGFLRCTGSGTRRVCNWTVTVATAGNAATARVPYAQRPIRMAARLSERGPVLLPPEEHGHDSGRHVRQSDHSRPHGALHRGELGSDRVPTRRDDPGRQRQPENFANWYAYYRTRNLLTRTALSRMFGQFGDNIRARGRTIDRLLRRCGYLLARRDPTIITNLNDTNAPRRTTASSSSTGCSRSARTAARRTALRRSAPASSSARERVQ